MSRDNFFGYFKYMVRVYVFKLKVFWFILFINRGRYREEDVVCLYCIFIILLKVLNFEVVFGFVIFLIECINSFLLIILYEKSLF